MAFGADDCLIGHQKWVGQSVTPQNNQGKYGNNYAVGSAATNWFGQCFVISDNQLRAISLQVFMNLNTPTKDIREIHYRKIAYAAVGIIDFPPTFVRYVVIETYYDTGDLLLQEVGIYGKEWKMIT